MKIFFKMLLHCGGLVQWRPCSHRMIVCSASPSVTAEQVRQELDNLHKEADTTRAKANNARMRLMRLSEAVERLRRQAAISVQTGKENDARELLFQKKKVVQAMEKLKNRIELFDELSAKLNEAISLKESFLIGNMALDLDSSQAEAPNHVRIVSPTEENQDRDLNTPEIEEDQNLQFPAKSGIHNHGETELNNHEIRSSEYNSSIADSNLSQRKVSKYEDFLEELDLQLSEIEQELETFLRYSNLLLDSKEKPEYSKVMQVAEILADINHARDRIAAIKQTNPGSGKVSL